MARFSRIRHSGLIVIAGLMLGGLAACSDYSGALPKHMRPLDDATRVLIERKGMEQRTPILVRIFKEEAALEVWKLQKASGRYALLKEYEICAWSGVLGPKIREGDRQAPEGFYTIRPAQMNPDSNYYLAFNMGYPNAFDRAHGRTGAELMVHGACSSRGCYSMTDENIQEIYTLGRLAFQGGQREFQVQAFPFRMTAENLARHRNDPNMPFWLMLKEGYDHFETIGQPPKVDVCDLRYMFNSVPAEGQKFAANAACPPMSMPERIRIAVNEKAAKDNEKMLAIAARLDRREGGDSVSALRLALATPTSAEQAAPMSVAAAPVSLEPTTTASVEPEQAAPATATTEPPSAAAETASPPVPRPAPAAAAVAETAPPPVPRPAPAVAAAPSQPPPSAPVTPAPVAESGYLPVPSLGPDTAEAAPPAPAASPSDAASLEERMLVESAPPDSGVANAYAAAEEDENGLTGFVLRLIQQ